MPKRVSLKGKGADLFFGDYAPDTTSGLNEVTPETIDTVAPPPDQTDTEHASLPAGHQASQHASMQADQQAGAGVDQDDHAPAHRGDVVQTAPAAQHVRKQASVQASKQVRRRTTSDMGEPGRASPALTAEAILEAIWADVCQQAPVTGSFRYTEQELAALTDASYELAKRHGVKFSKQDVARLALNAVLWDYQAHGDKSLLAAFVLRKRRQRGGQ